MKTLRSRYETSATREVREKLRYDNRELREAVDRLTGRLTSHANDLATIADIAEGSQTVNSLPHIAKIARAALSRS